MEFIKSNLWEIKKSPVLQIFGGLLAALHALTYWNWLQADKLPLQYHANPQPMCWSLFESCQWTKALSPGLMEVIFHSFGVLAIVAALVFFFTRIASLGWALLFVLLIFKGLLYVQDLRLSQNVHYLIFILNICFLFVPNKGSLLRWMIVSYYLATGLLKLSPNWLTGQWFVDQIHVPIKLGEWLAAVSVLVEMLAPVALFFRDVRNFLLAYFALIAYHGLMWYAGAGLEPMAMLALLQLFPLLFYEERKVEREYLYQSFIRPEPSKAWLVMALIAFWLIQAMPYIPHQSMQNLKHIENSLALAPVAASDECEQVTFYVYKDHLEEVEMVPPKDRPISFKCNAYLRFLDLKAACRDKSNDGDFRTVMSFLMVRSLKDRSYRTAFQSTDMCDDKVTFRTLVGSNNEL